MFSVLDSVPLYVRTLHGALHIDDVMHTYICTYVLIPDVTAISTLWIIFIIRNFMYIRT